MRRSRRLALLFPSVALALTLAAAPAHAADPVDYVAMGDSYSSGAGAPPYGLCFQSAAAYGPRWAATHDVSSFLFTACGGVTSQQMGPQFLALSDRTDLVTITIGGNDVGFINVVLGCVTGTDAQCTAAVDQAVRSGETTLPGRLDATYATIEKRAPRAEVVVLGYPRLVEPDGACLTPSKRADLNRGADALHEVISDRAAAAGVAYVDVRDHFAGHGACGPDPWINPFSAARIVESFHPNRDGYAKGYLALLNSVTD
ncbi:SGNH/GDSL hydrolase family protein [Pseudonocardia lacus]|uniref:SGNH/GDSL hydrolase family protein n=1 Tax=Pseudonocardia lacus TaxID=2835865 RepID=UPI001BDBF141|nr:SGNH/GDSL hydrolase family protein [Pseudonocardia lacus]